MMVTTLDFADVEKEHILSCTSSTQPLQNEYSLDKLLDGRSLEISESQARHLKGRDPTRKSVRVRNRSYQARQNYLSRGKKTPTDFL